MKTLLCISSVLLILTAPLHAQKPVVQDLPELQEWYSWSGAKNSRVSYLPNFSQNGGLNAITQLRYSDPTWFNRFAYDTVNQFSWKEGGSAIVMQIDFNNDGIMDYFDTGGRIYTSTNKGLMPSQEPVARVSVGSSGAAIVGDINKDGFPDLILPRTPSELFIGLDIVYGGTDLTKLRVAQPLQSSSSYGRLINMYLNENNELRMITYINSDFSEWFKLYGLTFEGTPNDSIIVNVKSLSFIKEEKANKTPYIFEYSTTTLYNSKIDKRIAFIISKSLTVEPSGRPYAYLIRNDSLIFYTRNTVNGKVLTGSIDGDDKEDIIVDGGKLVDGQLQLGLYLFSGNPLDGGGVRAWADQPYCGYSSSAYIGDINNDGIGDFAFGGGDGCFKVFLGIDWRKVGVNELSEQKLTLHQTEPNPVNNSGLFVLPMNLERSGHYTVSLYNLSGKLLGEIYSGELPSGSVRLPLNITTYQLPSGMYTLRLSDGKQTRERAFSFIR